jgi:hypothetical protein
MKALGAWGWLAPTLTSKMEDLVNNFVLALAGLLVSFAPMQAQKPYARDSAALIEMSRATTLAYSASLPDFVCAEVISRYRQVAVAAFAAPMATSPLRGRATDPSTT